MSDEPRPLQLSHFLVRPVPLIGIVCAAAPFFMSITDSAENSFNGVVTASYFRDYPAIGFGALGLVFGVLVFLSKQAETKVKTLVAAAILLFCARHLVYGFGVLRPGFTLTKPAGVLPPDFAKDLEPGKSKPKVECTAQTPDTCDEGCEGGNGEDCDELGVAYAKGLGGLTEDDAKALTLFDKACELKHANGCKNGSIFYREAAKDPQHALELAERGCELKLAESCNEAGVILDQGQGVAEDDSKAVSWFERACTGGSPMGCANLGNLLSTGRSGAEKDLEGAAAAWEKACGLDEFRACNNVGVAYCEGEGVEKNVAKGIELLTKSCTGKYGMACGNLGSKHLNGEGVEKDEAKAKEFFSQGCDAGHGRSCTEFGKTLDVPEVSFTYFEQGCEAGHAPGCQYAGVALRDGIGIEQNLPEAVKRLQSACDKGEKGACADLGLALADTDAARARPLLTAACKADKVAAACKALKTLGKKKKR